MNWPFHFIKLNHRNWILASGICLGGFLIFSCKRQLYMSTCRSVGWSVGRLVVWSVGQSVGLFSSYSVWWCVCRSLRAVFRERHCFSQRAKSYSCECCDFSPCYLFFFYFGFNSESPLFIFSHCRSISRIIGSFPRTRLCGVSTIFSVFSAEVISPPRYIHYTILTETVTIIEWSSHDLILSRK